MDYLSGDQDYLAPADSHLVELAGAVAADQQPQVEVPQPAAEEGEERSCSSDFADDVLPLDAASYLPEAADFGPSDRFVERFQNLATPAAAAPSLDPTSEPEMLQAVAANSADLPFDALRSETLETHIAAQTGLPHPQYSVLTRSHYTSA